MYMSVNFVLFSLIHLLLQDVSVENSEEWRESYLSFSTRWRGGTCSPVCAHLMGRKRALTRASAWGRVRLFSWLRDMASYRM